MQPITTTNYLAEVCGRLHRHPFVTVDTEFLRESTYYPKLCVAQIASTDEAVVVDALADGIDLKPLFNLMADENVIKVFHAARQDIEICWHAAGLIPAPLVDTQVAAMVLGYGDSIAYDQLVQRITGDNLDTAPALRGADRLRDLRRDASARRLRQAGGRPQEAWPHRMDAGRDAGAHLARHLPDGTRACVAAAADARAQ